MSSTYVIQAKGQLGPAKADSYGDSNRYAAGLTFINLSGPKQSKDKNLKKIVRSSAMRSYRQTEKQKAVTKREYRIKPHTSNSDHANNCNDELAVQEPVRIATKKMSERESGSSMVRVTEKNRPASPMKRRPDHNKNGTLGRRDMVHQGQLLQTTRISGRGDPFNAYPSRDSPLYNDYCMHHFVGILARRYLPIEPGNGKNPLAEIWIPHALADPLLFMATLNLAATHLDVCYGKKPSPITIHHKGETIRAINARIQDPAQALTNETIGSVVMLAALENLHHNFEGLAAHLNALARMVTLRGGLGELGWNGVLHMTISWEDLLSCSMMATSPQFPSETYRAAAGEMLFPSPMMNLVTCDMGEENGFCRNMTGALQNMRDLTEFHNDRRADSCSLEDLMNFGAMRSEIEHRLLVLKIRKPLSEMTIFDFQLESCRLGALLYIKCVFHRFLPLCPLVRKSKEQLKSLISEGEKRGFGSVDLPRRRATLIWALFIGGIFSLDKEEETWFAARIAAILRAFHVGELRNWTDMEAYLRNISWVNSLKTWRCLSLWNRVLALREEPMEVEGWPSSLIDSSTSI